MPEYTDIVENASNLKSRKQRYLLLAISVFALLCLVVSLFFALTAYFTVKNAAQDATELVQQLEQACTRSDTLDADLAQFCPKAEAVVEAAPAQIKTTPVPGPPGPSGQAGQTGAQGPGPSTSQVYSAVSLYCRSTKTCNGQDGANATPAQVALAVSTYCNSRGQCQGREGLAGADGQDAEPVTQQQVATAVTAYCAERNLCRGQSGEQGPRGEQGVPGLKGDTGVIGVDDRCGQAPSGQVVSNVDARYDPENLSIIITCEYRDDQSGIFPQNPQETP